MRLSEIRRRRRTVTGGGGGGITDPLDLPSTRMWIDSRLVPETSGFIVGPVINQAPGGNITVDSCSVSSTNGQKTWNSGSAAFPASYVLGAANSICYIVSGNGSANRYILSGSLGASKPAILYGYTGSPRNFEWYGPADADRTVLGADDDATHLHYITIVQVDAVSLKLWFDGTLVLSKVPVTGMAGAALGYVHQTYGGRFAGLVHCDAALTDEQVEQLHDWIRAEWGLT